MNTQPCPASSYADEPRLIRLENGNGMQITLMDWGATWLSCQVPLASGERREVLLGCAQPEDYRHQQAYLGAMIGRVMGDAGAGSRNHCGRGGGGPGFWPDLGRTGEFGPSK